AGDVVGAYDSLEAAVAASAYVIGMGPDALIELADCASALGDTEREEEVRARAVKHDSGDSGIHRRTAVFYARQGRFHDAIESLRQAISIDPDVIQYHAELALALGVAGCTAERDAELDWCLQRNATSPHECYYIGLAHHLLGKYDVAVQYHRQSLADPLVRQ